MSAPEDFYPLEWQDRDKRLGVTNVILWRPESPSSRKAQALELSACEHDAKLGGWLGSLSLCDSPLAWTAPHDLQAWSGVSHLGSPLLLNFPSQKPQCKVCRSCPVVKSSRHLFLDLPKVSGPFSQLGLHGLIYPLCLSHKSIPNHSQML